MIARFDGASSRAGFSTRSRDAVDAVAERALVVDGDDAVARHLLLRHALDGQHRAVHPLEDVDHLAQRRRIRVDHVVAEDDGERFVADQFARDQHGVAEAERLPLADVREVDQVARSCGLLRAGRACRALEERSSSTETSKWSSIAFLPRPVTRMMFSMPRRRPPLRRRTG